MCRPYDDTIYTHDEAARIIDIFEEILEEHDIKIPSPEDDEREEDNMAGLYGSTYGEVLDKIEERIICILAKHSQETKICSYVFSGNY